MKTWLFVLIANICFAMPEYSLPEIVVIARRLDSPKPIITERVKGDYLLNTFQENDFDKTVLLLAAYIHTQSRGNNNEVWLADKYGVAQVMLNIMTRQEKDLKEWLLSKSGTIKERKSNYFWLDPKDKRSMECIDAAYDVLKGNIPKKYNVGNAQAFLNADKISNSVRRKWRPSKINMVFIHTFYEF